ncbi:MAG: hypothetical protein IKA09_13385 [Lachnospiraceae bacterium]|nr:hypothetical protein [Lachnospiraceae bacterium]
MRNKVNEMKAAAKNKAALVLAKRDAGIETLMVIALVCVIAVALTAMFRTEAGNLINSIFETMTTNINDTMFKEFTA